MKKLTVLILFGLLIMAFGATVYAQQLEFRASGLVDTTGLWYMNIPTGGVPTNIAGGWPVPFQPTNPVQNQTLAQHTLKEVSGGAWNRPNAYMVSRMNLVFDANIGKELTGRLALEIDSMRWGTNPGEYIDAGRTARWRTDAIGLEVKHAYLDAALPYFGIPVPMTIRVGIQPLGYRPHVLMITDGAGITAGINLNPVVIAPMWGKPLEGKDAVSDDVDVYGLQATAKLGTLSFGGYGVWFNMNTYPLNAGPAGFGGTPTNPPFYGVSPAERADFWWAGAFLDGKLGPLNVQIDAIMDQGEVQARDNNNARGRDVDYRGYFARGKFEYPWEKFNFGAVGAWASGADLHQTNLTGRPGGAVANANDFRPATNPATGQHLNTPRTVRSFVVPPGSEQAGGTGDDFFLFGNFVSLEAAPLNYATSTGTLTNVVHRGAYGGLWFLKAFAGYKVLPWYKVTIEALYIGDTTKAGNTFGNAVTTDRIQKLKDDDDIGWEFNLINEVNIYKNLKWDLGAGYLIAGDALDQMVANTTVNTYVRYNKSPHNPWIVATKLRYTF
jgi:hypothetical protein